MEDVHSLKEVFPEKDLDLLHGTLLSVEGDLDRAIEVLLDAESPTAAGAGAAAAAGGAWCAPGSDTEVRGVLKPSNRRRRGRSALQGAQWCADTEGTKAAAAAAAARLAEEASADFPLLPEHARMPRAADVVRNDTWQDRIAATSKVVTLDEIARRYEEVDYAVVRDLFHSVGGDVESTMAALHTVAPGPMAAAARRLAKEERSRKARQATLHLFAPAPSVPRGAAAAPPVVIAASELGGGAGGGGGGGGAGAAGDAGALREALAARQAAAGEQGPRRREAFARAAVRIFASHNPDLAPFLQVQRAAAGGKAALAFRALPAPAEGAERVLRMDLHHLTVGEARQVVRSALQHCYATEGRAGTRWHAVSAVVGSGQHSAGGVCKLRPAVESLARAFKAPGGRAPRLGEGGPATVVIKLS